ncbi:MAG: OmpH family outer membrane protein [Acidobacteriota bacterium]|nr:OmpH family outer membrane protein [Acidobacteriota bacterium]
MKIEFIAVAFLAAIAVSPALAQTRPAGPPAAAPQTNVAVPESKIALIYSAYFQDPKTGIAKFNSLASMLNREFQPRQTELQQLQQKMQALNDEIEKTKGVAEPRALQQKVDQLEQWNKELQRKKEDGQAALEKRQREIFSPLQEDISKALEAFAKQRGINVIIDGSQVPVVYAADSIDVTRPFINDFNSKNPATASVTPPK